MALKDITLGQFFPGNTVMHRLDPRTKLLLVVFYIVALFMAKGNEHHDPHHHEESGTDPFKINIEDPKGDQGIAFTGSIKEVQDDPDAPAEICWQGLCGHHHRFSALCCRLGSQPPGGLLNFIFNKS